MAQLLDAAQTFGEGSAAALGSTALVAGVVDDSTTTVIESPSFSWIATTAGIAGVGFLGSGLMSAAGYDRFNDWTLRFGGYFLSAFVSDTVISVVHKVKGGTGSISAGSVSLSNMNRRSRLVSA